MNIYLNSVGCRLNQSEIERISNQFRMVGHEIVSEVEESDLVIINTCTVTSAAASDSRAQARQAYKRNPNARIILTGCWSTLEKQEAMDLPGVIRVIDNSEKDQLAPHILNLPQEKFDLEPSIRYPVPGVRMRTRAFIKAQDGCDNKCTFCIITIARGPARSRVPDQIIHEIQSAVVGGAQEAVLTGVQLTAYGKDLANRINLKTLIESILHHTDIPRLRLSSLEPWGLDGDFYDLWNNKRLCRQLHLPLQSGSKTILRRMGRPISPQKYASVVHQAREKIPSIAITTDIIVGFPGETENEFHETLTFIKEIRFAQAHVFVFSPRPGTSAIRLPNKIPRNISRQRSKQIREVIKQSAKAYRKRFIGEDLVVLWETATPLDENKWEMRGITDNYLRVRSLAHHNFWNQLTPVRILSCENEELQAEILADPQQTFS